MNENDKYDFEQLLNWVEGNLSEIEARKINTRLEAASDDDELKVIIEWLQQFQQLSQNYKLMMPSEALNKQLNNIFTKQAKQTQGSQFSARLFATLTFDSYQNLAPVGIRASTATKRERQFVYSTDLVEITVDSHWDAQEKSVNINGQLFPVNDADETIYIAELQKNNDSMEATPTDPLGKFSFTAIVPDIYDIILTGDQTEIVMRGLTLQF